VPFKVAAFRAIEPAEPVVANGGSDPVSTLPSESTAMQTMLAGHEMLEMLFVPSTFLVAHAATPPVGSVELKMSPVSSPATHESVVGQETERSAVDPSMSAMFQADASPVGFVDVTMSPASTPASVTTHNEADGQETAVKPLASGSIVTTFQLPEFGSVDVRA
jgi:hypothetical protein